MSTNNQPRRLLASLAALAIGVAAMAPRDAAAFCRTSTCGKNISGTRCTPAAAGDCGTPIFWPTACVSFSMQQDASKQVDLTTATRIFTEAFATWMAADCGPGTPHIELVDLGPVQCDMVEHSLYNGNANIFVFRDDGWPHEGQGDTLALTTVSFFWDSGEIFDVDIEVNSTQGVLTTGDAKVTDDLLSIATHEAGHFLGLAHTTVPTATMVSGYDSGTTAFRTLDPDDIEAICAAYPPGPAIPSTCDPTPHQGFSSVCTSGDPPAKGCCAVAPGSAPGSPDGGLALGALAASLVLRRISRRGRGW